MNIKKLLESRAQTWAAMSAIIDTAAAEGRGLTAEEHETYKRAEAELDGYTKSIEVAKEHAQRGAEFDDVPGVQEIDLPTTRSSEPSSGEKREKAFGQWLRGGREGVDVDLRGLLNSQALKPDEARALGVGTTTAGGYFVPQGFRQTIIETLKYYGAVRPVSTVIETDTGNTLPWPTNDDTGNVGAILAENATIAQLDVTLGQASLGAYMYTSKLVLVSYQLLQDSAFDLETFLARKLGQRIARIQNTHFTTGTGSSQPLGIQTNSTAGVTLPTGNTTTVTYAGLISLIHSIDPAYRYGGNQTQRSAGSGMFMLSDTALAAIRQLVDSQGHPLWQPSLQVNAPDTLLGYGYVVNNDMPVPAANAKCILFGDFATGYVIRDVLGVQTVRLDERYADALQVGFFAYCRSDATVQDSSAYKALKNSAT